MPTKVMGADLSLNHGAVVELTDGTMTGCWYYTDIAGAVDRAPDISTRWKPPNTKDRHIIQMERLVFFETWFDKSVLMPNMPEYLGIEDYALDAGHNAQHTGEIGGTARILAWFRGIRLRLHDPLSVKMYTAHHGHADKLMMEKAVAERWGESFGKYNGKPSKKGGKVNRQTSEDLCDAYAIAQMVWAEVQLRRGDVLLSDFHEQEIRVFNRLTKFMPVNLLDRGWIHNPDGVKTPHDEPTCPDCHSRKCCNAKKKAKVKVKQKAKADDDKEGDTGQKAA